MRTTVALIALSVAIHLVTATAASGQTTIAPPTLRPNTRPTTSPYLFLTPGGQSNAALNYYRQVRPQQNFLRTSQQQQRDLNTLNKSVFQLQQEAMVRETPVIGPTGHTATFFNTGSYFGNSPARAGLRGR